MSQARHGSNGSTIQGDLTRIKRVIDGDGVSTTVRVDVRNTGDKGIRASGVGDITTAVQIQRSKGAGPGKLRFRPFGNCCCACNNRYLTGIEGIVDRNGISASVDVSEIGDCKARATGIGNSAGAAKVELKSSILRSR